MSDCSGDHNHKLKDVKCCISNGKARDNTFSVNERDRENTFSLSRFDMMNISVYKLTKVANLRKLVWDKTIRILLTHMWLKK